MSPEQASGKRDIDTRCDLWACGVILYEMLTGTVPFDGDNYNEVMANILMEEPEKPRVLEPEIPEEIEAIILKALSKNKEDRFSSAAQMLEALEPFFPEGTVEIEGLALRPAKILDPETPEEGGTLHGMTGTVPPTQKEGASGKRGRSNSLSETQTAGQEISQSIRTLDIRHMSRTRLTLAALSALLLLIAAAGAFILMGKFRKRHKRANKAAVSAPGHDETQSPRKHAADRADGSVGLHRSGTTTDASSARTAPPRVQPGKPGIDAGLPGMAPPSRPTDQAPGKDAGTPPPARPKSKDRITVTLRNLPDHAQVWVDSKRVDKPPFTFPKDHRQHCIEVVKPGFKHYLKCFFPTGDRTFTVHLRRKKRPRNIYDSPY